MVIAPQSSAGGRAARISSRRAHEIGNGHGGGSARRHAQARQHAVRSLCCAEFIQLLALRVGELLRHGCKQVLFRRRPGGVDQPLDRGLAGGAQQPLAHQPVLGRVQQCGCIARVRHLPDQEGPQPGGVLGREGPQDEVLPDRRRIGRLGGRPAVIAGQDLREQPQLGADEGDHRGRQHGRVGERHALGTHPDQEQGKGQTVGIAAHRVEQCEILGGQQEEAPQVLLIVCRAGRRCRPHRVRARCR